MTVKCLNDIEKACIAYNYVHAGASSEELAKENNVSPRTINRVLVEKGVARTPKRKPKVIPAAPVVPLYTQQVELPITMVEPTFMEQVKGFFKSIFVKKQQQLNV